MKEVYVFGHTAFVRHPHLRGVWIKTDWSVAVVPCDYDECKAAIGGGLHGGPDHHNLTF